ncbi:hypothetical protein L596_010251 [Steinernema carpocapsae]|uniref:Uncharacterized protein n=1 Tax=Steinernema carpocapsae TaxID=34508 RepID=A0A4U5PIB5_STECR|nr:hypothetical protein L596_010251 [Steinernema carpocapsae]
MRRSLISLFCLLLLTGLTYASDVVDKKPRIVVSGDPMKCSRVVCDDGGVVNASSLAAKTTSDYAATAEIVAACDDCRFCGERGFSVCVRSTGKCFCDHFLPESCEELEETKRDDKSMEYCYRYALQKLPFVHPHIKETYTSVDVKQFWLQPYWSSLQPERLVFHYKYKEMVPEYCMGVFDSKNVCISSIDMEMSPDFEGMDWPLEMQIDNEVFEHTEKAEFWITVDVLEPSYTKGQQWMNVSSDVTILNWKTAIVEHPGHAEGEVENLEKDLQSPMPKFDALSAYRIPFIVGGVFVLLVVVFVIVYLSCRSKKQGYVAGKVERA